MSEYRGWEPIVVLMLAKLHKANHLCGLEVQGEAQRQAPVREGILRASAATETRAEGSLAVRTSVTFSTPYAARQHEELTYRHPKGGKAKYLEDPLKAYPYRQRLVDHMRF